MTKQTLVVVCWDGGKVEGSNPGDCNTACEMLAGNLAAKGY